jgi:GNAT superfamily N-acetyltransferase
MITVRRWSPADLRPCAALFVETFSRPPWNDRWPSLECARQYLESVAGAPGFRGHVAQSGGEILGACLGHLKPWWSGAEFFIDEMYVAPNAQRRGVGTALLEAVEAELRDAGVRRMALLTARGFGAEEFYRRRGFAASPRMVLMAKELA